MRLLAIRPKEQLRIASAQDLMQEAMVLRSRRLNNPFVSPPTRLIHDKTVHAAPDLGFPGRTAYAIVPRRMPRYPSSVAEQNPSATSLRHTLPVATKGTLHQNAPVFRSLRHGNLLCRRSDATDNQICARRSTVSGKRCTSRISSAACALGVARPCSQFSKVRTFVRR